MIQSGDTIGLCDSVPLAIDVVDTGLSDQSQLQSVYLFHNMFYEHIICLSVCLYPSKQPTYLPTYLE